MIPPLSIGLMRCQADLNPKHYMAFPGHTRSRETAPVAAQCVKSNVRSSNRGHSVGVALARSTPARLSFGPAVAQPDSTVEDEAAGYAVEIGAKITLALELYRLSRHAGRELRLYSAPAQHF